ncbi:Short chain dehydrogenase citE [Sparassis crispa]|uniref:Short chain dehydrogenase citE n=1 Tax=Sparassis crispa TaxID=139825 RepID=A0A401H5M4_9APHY|nr:Short chain dehydrogenase citE [Sparassis crispa]GBE89714.1 Short chain dehydrogenase citE [Sparassis crispa]
MSAHTGVGFVPTKRYDTYPAIDPIKSTLTGKVVLITGASRGIGRPMAIAFAQAAVSGLVLLARSDTATTEAACLAAQRPGHSLKVLTLAVDITNLEQVSDAARRVEEMFGRLDVIINNAGYADPWKTMGETDPNEWWRTWEVNMRGTFNVTHAFLPLLTKCGGDRTIMNLVSAAAHWAIKHCSAYQTSKFALMRFTELLMEDHGDQGVLAYAVHPCATPTDMNADLPEEVKKRLIDTPELAAHSIVWLARERREWLGGRYVSTQWDVDELLQKTQEIVKGDKLKFRMVV